MSNREYDLVLLGATGFTGRLVAEYLAAGAPGKWAIAGRNRDKLAALGLPAPVVVVDALDPAACAELARRTRVVCTTVGPYSRYGSAVVAACADAGTHYCDLTGEVHWMRQMIDAHHARAQQTGARIVHACGFDSIPSDLGTWAVQQEFIARHRRPARAVTAMYGEQRGGLSGGTIASAFAIAEAMRDPQVRRVLRDPHALEPDAARAPTEVRRSPIGWEPRTRSFTSPFLMASTNAPVVRRGHALAGHPWGREFVYREVTGTPGTARGLMMAIGMTGALAGIAATMARPRLRHLLERRVPQPGSGPPPEQRAKGYWRVRFLAEDGPDTLVYLVGDPHGDPGYASTSKMLGESAMCLARDPLTSPGGVLTPSVAMGGALLARLRRAGLTFAPA